MTDKNTQLVTIEDKDIQEIYYADNGLQIFVDSIDKMVGEFEYDLETAKGKKEIASFANSIARSKTYLDAIGKDLVSGVKAKLKIVDQNRKSMRDQLDELKIKARKPLTDYEEEQKAIAHKIQQTISRVEKLGLPYDMAGVALNIDQLNNNLGELLSLDLSHVPESLEIEKKHNASLDSLNAAIEKESKRIEQEKELKELRKKQEELERKQAEEAAKKAQEEREERLKKEAAEQAEREKIAAEERAKQAEKEKAEAEERAKNAEIEAKKKAEEAAELARLAEVERQEQEKQAEKERLEKLEANKRHVGAIRREIKEHIMSECGIDEALAKKVVLSLMNTPRVTINY